ncbi:MAG: hypothetical protein M1835_003684 [Candelina submexicana]|nr:MAG: hypothetical protein M1835_003684 [Candelina submexicana]
MATLSVTPRAPRTPARAVPSMAGVAILRRIVGLAVFLVATVPIQRPPTPQPLHQQPLLARLLELTDDVVRTLLALLAIRMERMVVAAARTDIAGRRTAIAWSRMDARMDARILLQPPPKPPETQALIQVPPKLSLLRRVPVGSQSSVSQRPRLLLPPLVWSPQMALVGQRTKAWFAETGLTELAALLMVSAVIPQLTVALVASLVLAPVVLYPAPLNANPGAFKVVGQAGVPAMHAGLLPNGRVVFLDKVENYTQVKLPNGQYAYSAEYDPATNTYVPLSYKSNAFCSGGAFLADGRFVSLGGNAPLDFIDPTVGDGFTGIRYLSRPNNDNGQNGQSWNEPGNRLASARWYASAQTMPNGEIFVASGSLNGLDPTVLANNNPTYEILDRNGVSHGANVPLEILEKNQPYYVSLSFDLLDIFTILTFNQMYPFVHLLNDGTLFIFTSKSSELFNLGTNTTVRTFPDLPGEYRTYPNTGGSVLLPLSSGNGYAPDVMICGGGAYQDITSPTEPSCGRIQPLATNAGWEMDSMPEGRGMVEGTLLPDGTVIWLNGCNRGAQGFNVAQDPVLEALLYDPTKALGQRWTTLASSQIPRLYHSVALLLLDGTMLIAGSNPVEQPQLQPSANAKYVTEFRVENYVPPYLQGDNINKRPSNVQISSKTLQAIGSKFSINFNSAQGAKGVKVALYHGGFVTHSVHMNHRMIYLDNTGFNGGSTTQSITVTMPPNSNVAPPGPYVVYVLVDGIPAVGQFVTVA